MNKQDCQKAFEKLFDYAENGKMLDCPSSGEDCRKLVYRFRNRIESIFYYEIKLKGNHITLTRTQYIAQDGEPANLFLRSIPAIFGDDVPNIIEKKEKLLKIRFKEYRDFLEQYKLLTPDLRG